MTRPWPAISAAIAKAAVGSAMVPGTWRELLVCPAERVVPVPDEVSDEDAAQALVNPVTAWALTMVEHRMQRGEWLTQTAAGSTLGRLILQLARSEGFRTIKIVYRRPQVSEIAKLGGDVTLCTEDDDWPAQLVKAGRGAGPSKAIDCVAGRIGAELARALAPGGRILVFGALSSHRQTERSARGNPGAGGFPWFRIAGPAGISSPSNSGHLAVTIRNLSCIKMLREGMTNGS